MTHRLLDGTGSIAVVTPEGALAFVTVTEAAPQALAVDAHGVVWATPRAIRAANL